LHNSLEEENLKRKGRHFIIEELDLPQQKQNISLNSIYSYM